MTQYRVERESQKTNRGYKYNIYELQGSAYIYRGSTWSASKNEDMVLTQFQEECCITLEEEYS